LTAGDGSVPSKRKGDEMKRRSRAKRKTTPIKHTLRLYYGEDDDLIDGLYELAAQPGKTINQVIKDALRQLIKGTGPGSGGVPVETVVNLAEIRQVVEAGVESALARHDGGRMVRADVTDEAEDDEAETWLDDLGAELVLDDEGQEP